MAFIYKVHGRQICWLLSSRGSTMTKFSLLRYADLAGCRGHTWTFWFITCLTWAGLCTARATITVEEATNRVGWLPTWFIIHFIQLIAQLAIKIVPTSGRSDTLELIDSKFQNREGSSPLVFPVMMPKPASSYKPMNSHNVNLQLCFDNWNCKKALEYDMTCCEHWSVYTSHLVSSTHIPQSARVLTWWLRVG